MKNRLLALVIIGVSILTGTTDCAFAQTFEREYTYSASESDSKLTARAVALNQVKTLLLEEIGVYIESNFENSDKESKSGYEQLSKQQLVSVTAGITQTKILEEKWDGSKYYIKARIELDINEVKNQVKRISQDRSKVKDMEDVKRKVDDAVKDIERLNAALEQVKDENEKLKLQQKYNEKKNEINNTQWVETQYKKILTEKPKYNKFGIGLGNPYLSLIYNPSQKVSIETRYASNFEDIWIYGLRGYYNWNRDKVIWYTALDAGFINFKGLGLHENGLGSKQGYMAGIYVGGSFRITPSMEFNIDIGPSQIDLQKGDAIGIEWIVNTGLRYYLF